jgi:enoyl-CoA hydratase/carnithine racemase
VSDQGPVSYAVVGSTATVTLDRPERRNALDAASLQALLDALTRAAGDDAVRVLVLTGAGTTFCSGADLRAAEQADGNVGFAESGPRLMVDVLEALLDLPKPTVARVQGHVAGGGNGLVAACDLAVAVEDAMFAFAEVRVGVAPAVISVVCLRVMRPRDAAQLMLTGARVPAARMLDAGLLTAVVPSVALDATVEAWCRELAAGAPTAVRETKNLLRVVPSLGRDEAFTYTAELSSRLFASEEAAEGRAAFAERRPPSWTTRV